MNVSALKTEVETAQEELNTLLASGLETFTCRKHLKDLKEKLTLAEQEEDKKRNDVQAKENLAINREAAEMTADIVKQFNDAISSLVNIETPSLKIPDTFAANIIRAHNNLAAAKKNEHSDLSEVVELRKRHSDLEAKRQEIISRRTAGNGDDEHDGQTLALIQADLEGLSALIDKKSNIQAVDTHQEEQAVSNAQLALDNAVKSAYVECLLSLVNQFEPSLVETARLLAAMKDSLSKNRYQPCEEIRNASSRGVF